MREGRRDIRRDKKPRKATQSAWDNTVKADSTNVVPLLFSVLAGFVMACVGAIAFLHLYGNVCPWYVFAVEESDVCLS